MIRAAWPANWSILKGMFGLKREIMLEEQLQEAIHMFLLVADIPVPLILCSHEWTNGRRVYRDGDRRFGS